MHGIYRQNFGFTDIVIGRKHADAPYDDGTAIWGDFDAQEIFGKLERRPEDQAGQGRLRRLLRFGRPRRSDGEPQGRKAGLHLRQGRPQDAAQRRDRSTRGSCGRARRRFWRKRWRGRHSFSKFSLRTLPGPGVAPWAFFCAVDSPLEWWASQFARAKCQCRLSRIPSRIRQCAFHCAIFVALGIAAVVAGYIAPFAQIRSL